MSEHNLVRNHEPAGEIRFGQVGVANLRVRQFEPELLERELAEKVTNAPQLFNRAPVIVDLGMLSVLPEVRAVQDLLMRIRRAGLLPVGLSYGTSANDELAQALDVPVFARFRSAYEPAAAEAAPPAEQAQTRPTETPAAAVDSAGVAATTHHGQQVRSGQQVYARGGDLVVTQLVSNGAEVIADGSVHVYAPLRGRALAGAQGDTSARIYCQQFEAELVSIAGHYRVLEDIPPDLRGHPVQAWLEGNKLLLARLD